MIHNVAHLSCALLQKEAMYYFCKNKTPAALFLIGTFVAFKAFLSLITYHIDKKRFRSKFRHAHLNCAFY